MDTEIVFYSPRICYKITRSHKNFNIEVYEEGFANSIDKTRHCFIEDFCCDIETATTFVKHLSSSCAMPVHIPELAEEFLSI